MLSRFHLIPEHNGQTDRHTDRRTDRFAISISHVSMLTCDKNGNTLLMLASLMGLHEKNCNLLSCGNTKLHYKQSEQFCLLKATPEASLAHDNVTTNNK